MIRAIEYARENGARTFAVGGYDGGRLKAVAHKSLIVQSQDMQKIEDCHVILFHCTMQYFATAADGRKKMRRVPWRESIPRSDIFPKEISQYSMG